LNTTAGKSVKASPAATTTYVVTGTDLYLCTGTAAVTVTVDNIPPVANCKNVTIYLNSAGTAGITTADVNNNSTDNCGIASMTVVPDAFTCANSGTNTVVLTVTDVHGNVASCSAVVTVLDTIKPTFTRPPNATLYKDALCAVDDTPSGPAGDVTDEHDNCSTNLQATHTDV